MVEFNFNVIRRVVSGKKARDKEAGADLDLCYITDQIVIMGFPATGIEGLYRNNRKDVKEWLQRRHGQKWLIMNFCPRSENSYPSEYFNGQVARFPFPDHHPPPISLIPIFVRRITKFLKDDPERVAVIHCKAGKGRSGTMTCCYLISLPSLPKPPQLLRNYSKDKIPKADSSSSNGSPYIDVSHTGSASSIDSTSSSTASEVGIEGGEDGGEKGMKKRSSSSGGVAKDALGLRGSRKGEKSKKRAEALPRDRARGDQPGPDDNVNLDNGEPPQSSDNAQVAGAPAQTRRSTIAQKILGKSEDAGPAVKPATLEAIQMADKIAHVFELHTSQRMKDPKPGSFGVSIPSQRRWVRYWSRILSGGDPRSTPEASTNPERGRRIKLVNVKVGIPDRLPGLPVPLANKNISVRVARYKDSIVEPLRQRELELENRREEEEEFDDSLWDDEGKMIEDIGGFVESGRGPDTGAADALDEKNEAEKAASPVRTLIPNSGMVTSPLEVDREIQFKIVLGDTGRSHSKLPDIISIGYVWLIPSFERDVKAEGAETVRFRSGDDQIDFSKKQAEVEFIEITWEWMSE